MELNRKSNLVVAAVQEAALRRQITATEEILKIESAELDLVRQGFSVGVVSQTDVLSKEALLDQAARLCRRSCRTNWRKRTLQTIRYAKLRQTPFA